MKKVLAAALVLLAAVAVAQDLTPKLDSVYRYYVTQDYAAAAALLDRLDQTAVRAADRFAVKLEIGDFLLDRRGDYPAAESVYNLLLEAFPKEKRRPDVIYRLALAQELQEEFLDAAKNYEQVATRYMKSTYGEDALDAIERCFRKNYQDRVAYVNGFPLTRIELDERISRNPAAYEPFEKKQQLLDTMIDNRLLYEAAVAAGVFADPELVKALWNTRNRYVFEEWYNREVNEKAEPSEKMLKAQYQRDRSAHYTTPEKVHGFQIVVPEKTTADSLRRALAANPTLVWDSLARQYSTAPDKERGGDMGLFARGVHPKPIEQAAFGLKPGQVSMPVKTDQGYTIIKVTERQPATVRPFSEVRNQILVQLRQDNVNRLYEQKVEELKRKAQVALDSNAIAEGKDTLAVVDGVAITKAQLDERIEQIPPFFRGQFQSPEGKQRILDQMVLENLILRDCEAKKTWLWNKVVDRVLGQQARLAIDRYRSLMASGKVVIDSNQVKADYRAGISEFNVPAQVHVREIAAASRDRATQLRAWAVAGRLPALVEGRGLLVTDPSRAEEIKQAFATTGNTDSLVAAHALAGSPALPGTPTTRVGGKEVPNAASRCRLAGPYRSSPAYGFAFADLSAEDRLFTPEIRTAETAEALSALLGETPETDSAGKVIVDSARLGTYLALEKPLPAGVAKELLKLSAGQVSEHRSTDGVLLLKVTKKDSAQKADFSDVVRRFSVAGSRWSGGDLNWLTRDDKTHDAKLVGAAFELPEGGISQVMKLGDTTFTFIKVEEKKKAYTRPLDEVRPKLEDKLRRAEEQKLEQRLFTDLRENADIEILMKESDFIFETEPTEETPVQEGERR